MPGVVVEAAPSKRVGESGDYGDEGSEVFGIVRGD